MAINIKDEETDRLARELATLTGLPITVAVREAVSAQLDALRRRSRLPDQSDLSDIITRGRARRALDDGPEDEILGYGPDGLPT
jgi:antitoxin VapB